MSVVNKLLKGVLQVWLSRRGLRIAEWGRKVTWHVHFCVFIRLWLRLKKQAAQDSLVAVAQVDCVFAVCQGLPLRAVCVFSAT